MSFFVVKNNNNKSRSLILYEIIFLESEMRVFFFGFKIDFICTQLKHQFLLGLCL